MIGMLDVAALGFTPGEYQQWRDLAGNALCAGTDSNGERCDQPFAENLEPQAWRRWHRTALCGRCVSMITASQTKEDSDD